MDNNVKTPPVNRKKRRRRKKKRAPFGLFAFLLILIVVIITGTSLYIKKYGATKEMMELSEYFVIDGLEEAAVILNGEYDPEAKRDHAESIVVNFNPYIELSYLKEKLDDGYVYDKEEEILRYVTESEVYSAKRGEYNYTKGAREVVDYYADIILQRDETTYINLSYVQMFTDINVRYEALPNRVMIETAGTEKTVATLTKNAAIRRFGGPKSRILKLGIKGDKVQFLEDYGKWSLILTEDGVLGCVKNNQLSEKSEEVVRNRLDERVYTHNLLDKKINMAWHPIYSQKGNGDVANAVKDASGLNVISPSWYKIADNSGNVSSLSSLDYVNYCHGLGIEVWPMVSNFEVEGVDSTSVLNRTSSRDNLVNSLVAAAIRDNVDGVNIDFESLSIEAKDGFIEFIKELSIKCKANDIILSVANYKPEGYTAFYNRKVQAQYADYIMVMAYDEYHGDSVEPGSTASLPFVRECVEDTLLEVPANQLVLALPFYTRLWTREGASLTQKSYGMAEINRIVENNKAEKTWLNDKGQYYAKYEKNGRVNEVWLEDEESLSKKLQIGKDNKLAGYSFWRLGLEPASIWGVIANYTN